MKNKTPIMSALSVVILLSACANTSSSHQQDVNKSVELEDNILQPQNTSTTRQAKSHTDKQVPVDNNAVTQDLILTEENKQQSKETKKRSTTAPKKEKHNPKNSKSADDALERDAIEDYLY